MITTQPAPDPGADHDRSDWTSALRLVVCGDGRLLPLLGDVSGPDRLQRRPEFRRLLTAAVSVHTGGITFYYAQHGQPAVRVDVLPDARANAADLRGQPRVRESIVHVDPVPSLPYLLTLRELDVLTLMLGGLTNQEIAQALETSVRTVTTHVDRVLTKTHSPTRTAAAVLAMDQGLVRLPVPGSSSALDRLPWGKVQALAAGRPVPVEGARRRVTVTRPLVIGAALPLVGAAAEDGLQMLHGTQLALQEVNQRGGVAGQRVELLVRAVDVNEPESVRMAFTDLAEAGVEAMTSGYVGRQDIAHDIAAAHGSPYLHAATLQAMADRVANNADYRRIFQVCPSDIQYGPGFVRAISHIRDDEGCWTGSREVVTVQSAWPMADIGHEEMGSLADQFGWYLGDTVPLGDTREEWVAAAKAIRHRGPSAVLISDYLLPATVGFIREFLRDPPPTLLYALYSPSIPAFRRELGSQAEGILWATVTGTYSDPIGQTFARRYRAKFGENPGRSHAGIAYDRTKILTRAWATSGNARDFAAVAEEIRSTVYRGVNGAYHFDRPEQVALSYPDVSRDPSLAQAHLVYQIQGLRHRILAPDPYTEATFRWPPWVCPFAAV